MANTVQLTKNGQPVFPVTDRSLVMGADPHGATSERPSLSSTQAGFVFFDTTIGKPIWWDGASWVDATGANV